jgi:hypothetical protein
MKRNYRIVTRMAVIAAGAVMTASLAQPAQAAQRPAAPHCLDLVDTWSGTDVYSHCSAPVTFMAWTDWGRHGACTWVGPREQVDTNMPSTGRPTTGLTGCYNHEIPAP